MPINVFAGIGRQAVLPGQNPYEILDDDLVTILGGFAPDGSIIGVDTEDHIHLATYLSIGATPAATGAIRLTPDEYITALDVADAIDARLLGYDLANDRVSLDADGIGTEFGGLAEFLTTGGALGVQIAAILDPTDATDAVLALGLGTPDTSFYIEGTGGLLLANLSPLRLLNAAGNAAQNFVSLSGANVLVLMATGIPIANPHVVGQVWANSGVLEVSAG